MYKYVYFENNLISLDIFIKLTTCFFVILIFYINLYKYLNLFSKHFSDFKCEELFENIIKSLQICL